ncbi:hypothetical protein MNBD_GAMMA02-989, partial [hydrothermal vent metagenome]
MQTRRKQIVENSFTKKPDMAVHRDLLLKL